MVVDVGLNSVDTLKLGEKTHGFDFRAQNRTQISQPERARWFVSHFNWLNHKYDLAAVHLKTHTNRSSCSSWSVDIKS